MNYKQKTLFFFSLGILFVFSVEHSFAQNPGMGALRVELNKQSLNQQLRMQLQMAGMRGGGTTIPEYSFQITMRDSTKKEILSAIYTDTIIKKNYLLWIDTRYKKSDTNRFKKIYPSQTLYVAQITTKESIPGVQNESTNHIFGRPADSCWMFNVKPGVISAYSYIGEEWDDGFSPSTIVGIQLNDGPIVKYNKENLQQMIKQDADAMKYFDKKKYFKAIDKYNRDIEKAVKK